jgi:hypothetical protein
VFELVLAGRGADVCGERQHWEPVDISAACLLTCGGCSAEAGWRQCGCQVCPRCAPLPIIVFLSPLSPADAYFPINNDDVLGLLVSAARPTRMTSFSSFA